MKMNIKRGGPFAASLVIVGGLLLSGGGYAAANAVVNTSNVSQAATQSQLEDGKKLFLANCASCHGKNGVGTSAAPSLIGVGGASAEFQIDSGRMPAQASGPQMQVKPKQFTDEEVDALVAYVASLGVGPSVPTEDMIAADGDAVRGGELFRINCAMCHNAVGAGGALTEGKYAPELKGVPNDHIYEAMLTGPQNMPVFNDANLTPKDKKDIITYLKFLDENPSAGGYELAGLGPVAEGLFIWILGLGVIIGFTVWLGAKSN